MRLLGNDCFTSFKNQQADLISFERMRICLDDSKYHIEYKDAVSPKQYCIDSHA